MCGLIAIFSYDEAAPPVNEAELLRMREAMVARGPDGAGLWVSDNRRIGMAHRRLAIIDVGESGAQPMALKDQAGNIRLQISYNGEIYNFRQLREELIAEGRKFSSQSDTEVLLHLYDRDGVDMLRKLRGMFAFALWDEAKQGLMLARDPYGIKPLYYANEGGTVRVASQVKALLAGGAIPSEPNPAGHVGFFTMGYVPEPLTLYKNINALPAGSSLWIGRDGSKIERRFFDFTAEMKALEDANHSSSQEELRAALLESVELHLVSDVPVGMFLSAGLDSASVMALTAELAGSQMESMTLRFEEFVDTPNDEAPLAAEIASLYDTRHQTRMVKGTDFSADKARLLSAMDQPSIDGVNTYFVAKEAAAMGLKVALSGLGGDELLGGYDSFRQIPSLVSKLGWVPGLRQFGAGFRVLSGPVLKQFTSAKYASLLEYSADYGSAYYLRRGLFMPWELPEFLDDDLVREGWQNLDLLMNLNATIDGVKQPRNKVSLLESNWYMRNQLLRDADWAGMAHSLEIRTPLVDATLFSKIAARNFTKQDMARTPKTPLPNSVLNRPKTGFFIPVRDWLQEGEGSAERGVRGWAKAAYNEAVSA